MKDWQYNLGIFFAGLVGGLGLATLLNKYTKLPLFMSSIFTGIFICYFWIITLRKYKGKE